MELQQDSVPKIALALNRQDGADVDCEGTLHMLLLPHRDVYCILSGFNFLAYNSKDHYLRKPLEPLLHLKVLGLGSWKGFHLITLKRNASENGFMILGEKISATKLGHFTSFATATSSGLRKIFVCAASPEQRNEWLSAIKAVLKEDYESENDEEEDEPTSDAPKNEGENVRDNGWSTKEQVDVHSAIWHHRQAVRKEMDESDSIGSLPHDQLARLDEPGTLTEDEFLERVRPADCVYENQAFGIGGWQSATVNWNGRGRFSDANGSISTAWVDLAGSWEVDRSAFSCDEDGWQYANGLSFDAFSRLPPNEGGQEKAKTFVRRRLWRRIVVPEGEGIISSNIELISEGRESTSTAKTGNRISLWDAEKEQDRRAIEAYLAVAADTAVEAADSEGSAARNSASERNSLSEKPPTALALHTQREEQHLNGNTIAHETEESDSDEDDGIMVLKSIHLDNHKGLKTEPNTQIEQRGGNTLNGHQHEEMTQETEQDIPMEEDDVQSDNRQALLYQSLIDDDDDRIVGWIIESIAAEYMAKANFLRRNVTKLLPAIVTRYLEKVVEADGEVFGQGHLAKIDLLVKEYADKQKLLYSHGQNVQWYLKDLLRKLVKDSIHSRDTLERLKHVFSLLSPFDRGLTAPRLNIVMLVVGSRGDVQPFVAFGRELKAYGHHVRIATHMTFKDFVLKNGLDFFPLAGDPKMLMEAMVHHKQLLSAGMLIDHLRTKRPWIKELLQSAYDACTMSTEQYTSVEPFRPHALLANPAVFAGPHLAEKFGIPLHMAFTMPWTPTKEVQSPFIQMSLDSDAAKYLSFHTVDLAIWAGVRDLIVEWRQSTLGLGKPKDGYKVIMEKQIPFTYCFSEQLLAKPKDWPPWVNVSGFWFLDEDKPQRNLKDERSHENLKEISGIKDQENPVSTDGSATTDSTEKLEEKKPSFTPSKELVEFLEAPGKDPPVFIGFGSIVVSDPEALLRLVLEAVHLSGERALVQQGWSGLSVKMMAELEKETQQSAEKQMKADENSNISSQSLSTGNDDTNSMDDLEKMPSSKANEAGVQTDKIFFIGPAPHDWLFDQCKAVVHHGGAGTTAAGLRAGKPTVIVPFFGDQYFWANIVHRNGLGPVGTPYTDLTAQILAAEIKSACTAAVMRRCSDIGQVIRREADQHEGTLKALQYFHMFLPLDVMCCQADDCSSNLPATVFNRTLDLKLCSVCDEAILRRAAEEDGHDLRHAVSEPAGVAAGRRREDSYPVHASDFDHINADAFERYRYQYCNWQASKVPLRDAGIVLTERLSGSPSKSAPRKNHRSRRLSFAAPADTTP